MLFATFCFSATTIIALRLRRRFRHVTLSIVDFLLLMLLFTQRHIYRLPRCHTEMLQHFAIFADTSPLF